MKLKKKLALTTVIGLLVGIGSIMWSIIELGEAHLFINLPSFLIIVGGTFAVVVASFPLKRLKTMGAVISKAFVENNYDLVKEIDKLVAICEISRKQGLLAVENVIDEYATDDFFKKGLLLLVDGADKDYLRSSLQSELYFMQVRHKEGGAMIGLIASTAPALGLVGTYVGLIPMLQNVSDPDALGPMMALELVSSFYGAFLANLIFLPISKRLKSMSEEEVVWKELLIEGITGIQEGRNPRLLREELMGFLSHKEIRRIEKKAKPDVIEEAKYGRRTASN